MPTPVSAITQGLSIVRIEELDTCPVEVLRDKLKNPWGLVEVEGKVYKYNIRDAAAGLDGNDPRVPALLNRVEELERAVAKLILGIDENEVIEP